MEDLAIKLEHIDKDFLLPHERVGSVKGAFVQAYKRRLKTPEKQHALKDIGFEVKEGEFFGIVGRNGSGKSTLLKILAGIYQPTRGRVVTKGRLVPFIELGVGFNPELTGRENIYLNGAILGFSRKEIDAMYHEIVEFAELGRFMDQKLKNYSSGMQVRLAFSMATRSEADILLVDEVLAVGDADFQRKCFEYFRKLKRNKKTVVFVSHDMGAVREYCDRAILIDNSKIVMSGNAEEIAKEYIKLFSTPLIHESNNAAKWGAGGVDMLEVKTSKKVYTEQDETIEVLVTVKALTDFSGGLVPGITIKNDAGQALCGTNTKILKLDNFSIAEGQSKTLVWRIPNVFNEGVFIVEPAISDGETMEVNQWWNDAREFRVLNEYKTPYSIVPRITCKLQEGSRASSSGIK